jgi:hypothetical protein
MARNVELPIQTDDQVTALELARQQRQIIKFAEEKCDPSSSRISAKCGKASGDTFD